MFHKVILKFFCLKRYLIDSVAVVHLQPFDFQSQLLRYVFGRKKGSILKVSVHGKYTTSNWPTGELNTEIRMH